MPLYYYKSDILLNLLNISHNKITTDSSSSRSIRPSNQLHNHQTAHQWLEIWSEDSLGLHSSDSWTCVSSWIWLGWSHSLHSRSLDQSLPCSHGSNRFTLPVCQNISKKKPTGII